MEKGGFEINLDDIQDDGGLVVDTPVVEKVDPEKKPDKKGKGDEVEDPNEDNLIIVDVPAVDTEDEDLKEKEEEEKEKESKSGKSAGESKETESPSFLHATALRDKGVLPNLDLDKLRGLSDEEILEATIWGTQDEIDEGVKSIVEQQDEAYKEFIEMMDTGADLNEYARIKASQKRFDGLTDEKLEGDTEIQKALVAEDMKDRGMDDDDISDTLEDLEEKEEKLLSKAKTARKRIKERDENRQKKLVEDAEKQQESAKKQQEEVMSKINTSLDKTKEIIPGIPLSKKEKDIVKRMMTVPVSYENGVPVSKSQEMRSKDPVSWEIKLAYYAAIGLFDESPKWDRVKKRMESDAALKLLKSVNSNVKHTAGKPAAKITADDEGPIIMPFS